MLPGLELDLVTHELMMDKDLIMLTGRQFELMAYFMRNPGRVISRRELLKKVWHTSSDKSTRTVDVHVAALRKKLRTGAFQIEAVYKAGYRLSFNLSATK